ncbi:MAG: hypothetical protein MI919_38535 [Holophagales bacterium]|nr:hypothetical protein [Holophagales bacterium]
MKTRVLIAALLLLSAASASFAQSPDSSGLQSPGVPTAPLGGPACAADTTYAQPLDPVNFFTARTSDVQPTQQAWEGIVGGGTIVPFTGGNTISARVWGLSIEFDPVFGFVAFCGEDHTALTEYNVEFYADNAGVPAAAPSFTTTAVPTITDTGIPFAFTTIFQYDLTLADPAPEGYEWVSFVRQTGQQAGSGNDCYWLWVDETLIGTYDDMAFSLANGVETSDQTMCITASAIVDPTEIPTSNTAGLIALFALLAAGAFFAMRRFS